MAAAEKNAFEILGLPVSLAIDPAEIESAWQGLSREAHPDNAGSGDSDRAAEINRAREMLRTPGARLRHWLEIRGREIPRNASLNDKLMTQFSEVGALLAETDTFLEKKKAATSAIAKAILAEEEFAVQKSVQEKMGDLKSQIDGIEARFPELEADEDEAVRGLERLRFVEKWNAQLQDRLVAILM
ncbi:MAG: hypothetical protein HKN23_02050 [Verrucomicrobiales bacterium]|nr:hypothetical protein [Verrucomicrobiales bacterium]